MFIFLQSLDRALFFLLNEKGQNFFFDWFMPFMTNLHNFVYVLLALAVWIFWSRGKAGLVFLVFVGLTLTITDQFSSHVLKNWIGRIRPCQVLPAVHMLTDCNTSFSFPSSHAVNIFASAFFLARLWPKLFWLIYGIAAVVGYSRIYIGIHYPGDVLGGAGIGILIAWPMYWLQEKVAARWKAARSPKPSEKAGGGGRSQADEARL
jgi:undecaprenyl-diphosphatase